MKQVTKNLVKELKKQGFTSDVGDGYLNIARKDGVHCEFYPCFSNSEVGEVYTATYVIDDKKTDLDFELPFDQSRMIEAVKKILK